jgi:hypothetical protein
VEARWIVVAEGVELLSVSAPDWISGYAEAQRLGCTTGRSHGGCGMTERRCGGS